MCDAVAAEQDIENDDSLAELLRADPKCAAERLLDAARHGDVAAQFVYAQMRCEGRGVPLDAAEGLHWYSLAANSGHAAAMNMVGRCHELGHGTTMNAELAAAWYRRAAQR